MPRILFLVLALVALSFPARADDKSEVVVTELSSFAGCKVFLAAVVDPKQDRYLALAEEISQKAGVVNSLTVFYPPKATYLDGSARAVVSIKEGVGQALWLQNGKQPAWGGEDAACLYFTTDLYAEAEKDPEAAALSFVNQNVSVIGQATKIEKVGDDMRVLVSSAENSTALAIAEDPADPTLKKLKAGDGVIARCLTRDFDGKMVNLHHCLFFPMKK